MKYANIDEDNRIEDDMQLYLAHEVNIYYVAKHVISKKLKKH